MLITLINVTAVLAVGIAGTIFSGHPFEVIATTGALLIALTAQSLCKENRETATRLQVIIFALVTVLAILCGSWWGFLAFACMDGIKKVSSATVASVMYVVCAIVRNHSEFEARTAAEMILYASIIAAIIWLILALKQYADSVKKREVAAQERLLKASVSEMNERRINRELSMQNYQTERNARLLERENISRNIHNSVGHSITAAVMTLDAADMFYDTKPEEARRRMNEANDRIRGSLESIRSAVRALDEEGGELPLSDLIRYLRNAAEEFTMDTERTVDIVTDCYAEDISVPRVHIEFLTGVLQEALTNGVKHGGAKHFTVLLSADSAHVRLTVKDDGESDFNEDVRQERIEAGFGLRKIASYAGRCGGHAEFAYDSGFRTEVELPTGGKRAGDGSR